MDVTMKLEGLGQVDAALASLPSATSKSVAQRTLKESGQPVARRARSLVRERFGDLRESIDVSPRLSRTQKQESGKDSDVEIYIGPGSHPQAITEEFGKFNQPANPYLTPAWDAEKNGVLDDIGARLWVEIERAAARQARKAARLKG